MTSKMKRPALLLAAFGLLSGCAHIQIDHNLTPEAKLFSFHSGEETGYVSVYYLVTSDGAHLFDVPMMPIDVQNLGYDIRINSPHALESIFLTGPLPERFVGASALVSSTGAELHASKSTALVLEEMGSEILAGWDMDPADAESQVLLEPHHILETDTQIRVDGIKIQVIDGGAGPAPALNAYYLPQLDALIPGSLVFSDVHPVVTEGRSDVWIASLEELAQLGASQVMAGQGLSGGPELIQDSILYLRTLQEMVADWAPDGRMLTPDLSNNIQVAMVEAFPSYRLVDALPLSIEDEWRRQGGHSADEGVDAPVEVENTPATSTADGSQVSDTPPEGDTNPEAAATTPETP